MKNYYQYLIVDDDNTNNLICEFTIKRVDKEAGIHTYNRAEDALIFLNSKELSASPKTFVMLLDVNMPEMTGFEFLEAFVHLPEEVQKKVKIYMLTSSIQDFSSQAAEFPVVRGFLPKPLQIGYLERIKMDLDREISRDSSYSCP